MPSTRAGANGANPFDQARLAARELARQTGHAHHDVLVVLGAGLVPAAAMLGAEDPAVDLTSLPWFSRLGATGRRPEAWSIAIGASRVLVTAGRLHLYEGRTPAEVVHPVRTAIAAGARTVVLTCMAGAIARHLVPGRPVAIADHLGLTGTSPLTGLDGDRPGAQPYLDMTDAWSPHLRALAKAVEPSLAEGVYAQMPGPQLETPAEARMLAALGADLVGMSTVPEAIAARHLGAQVLGLAVVTGPAAGTVPGPLPVGTIDQMATAACEEVARIVRGVIERLEDAPPPPTA